MSERVYLNLPDALPVDFPSGEYMKKSLDFLISYFEKENSENYEVSLSVVSDDEIRELNRDYRKKDKKTDVLSFPMLSDDEFPIQGPIMLGDIVISLETCEEQAAEIGHSVRDEFSRLLVHGFLHLMGYDHEISEEEDVRMRQKEDELLQFLEEQGL